MASPLLPYLTLRILGLPLHKTKADIKTLFEPADSESILYMSLAKDVLPSSLPSQVATITFASESPSLQALLEEGKISENKSASSLRFTVDRMFHGFTPFNDPISTDRGADIVSITGLGGNAFVSWQHVSGRMWLRDLLPTDVPNLRTFTYGYSSALWDSRSTAILADYTDDFLRQLRNCSSIGRNRPLFLVGHSIGCMMIKEALIKLSSSVSAEDTRLFNSIYAICLFGAPNRGIRNAELLRVYGDKLPGQVLRDLGAGSAVLNAMNEAWIEVSKKVKIVTCFELCHTPTVRYEERPVVEPKRDGPPIMMVSRDSACFYTDNETRIPINHNHSMIAKLSNEPDSAYHTIARTIRHHVQEALRLQEERDFSEASTILGDLHVGSSSTPTGSVDRLNNSSNATYALAAKNIFMSTSETKITMGSRKICEKLLDSKQMPPTGTLFDKKFFSATCERMRNQNEARVFRDITPLIVPSAEDLCFQGSEHLCVLVESVYDTWSHSVPVIGTRPCPSFTVGFSPRSFSEAQLKSLEPFAGELIEKSFFKATNDMYFPFLTCQAKCGHLGLDVADTQNMVSQSMAVRGVVELFKLVHKEAELSGEILAFSVSHDQEQVRIYGHYAVLEGPRVSYCRQALRKFNLSALDGKDRWSSYQFIRNVYDIWMPMHRERLLSAVDELSKI